MQSSPPKQPGNECDTLESQNISVYDVRLTNFTLVPSYIEVVVPSIINLHIGQNKRAFSSVYSQARPFLFTIQEMDMELPPLSTGQQYLIPIEAHGTYVLTCINHCKLSLQIKTTQNLSSFSSTRTISRNSSIFNADKMIGFNSEADANLINNYVSPQTVESPKLAEPTPKHLMSLEEFEQFMAKSLNQNSNEIPEYLASTFKNQLSMLDSIVNKFQPDKQIKELQTQESVEVSEEELAQKQHQTLEAALLCLSEQSFGNQIDQYQQETKEARAKAAKVLSFLKNRKQLHPLQRFQLSLIIGLQIFMYFEDS